MNIDGFLWENPFVRRNGVKLAVGLLFVLLCLCYQIEFVLIKDFPCVY